MTRRTPLHLLDPVKLWDGLTPDVQRQLGLATVIMAVATFGASQSDDHGWDAAGLAGVDLIGDTIDPLLPTPPRRPDLAAIGVRACDCCGCTDAVACPGGCSWIGPNLCSRCAT